MNDLYQTVFVIERSDDVAAALRAVREAIASLGYDRFILASLSPVRDEFVERVYWVEGDWFDDGSLVDPDTYMRHCPITRHVLATDEPFFWSKTRSSKGERYEVVRRPKGTGIHGLQIPIFGRTGLKGAVSFGGEKIDSSARARFILEAIGAVAFRTAQRLLEGPGTSATMRLSPREREVLRWIAAGRRQADIAVTLRLSERTVENHLRRARHRLGVATTAQAVRAAIQSGELGD
ncbi:MAG: autoinducer binding domain-containing protein [Candidatus Competibacteraceae bacterium]|nr:autoinducer binding domain-containing protein [Candidatus Competibacteraceae bacterium]